MISTRGRYALRAMLELAARRESGFVPMREVARAQQISLKYLEQILPLLRDAGLVEAIQGKGGGYRLAVAPDKCRVWDVLCLTEGNMVPVSCLQPDVPQCPRAAACATLPLWRGFERLTREYFEGVTLADLSKNHSPCA